jgi:ribosomal protein L17
MLLQAPEKEQKMIAYACSVYQSLQTKCIAAETHHQLLLEAQAQHHIAKVKGSKAKSVKQHADRLVSLALDGLFAACKNACGGYINLGKAAKLFLTQGYLSNNYFCRHPVIRHQYEASHILLLVL